MESLLGLEKGELGRSWPFFALYAVLSAAFTLADGLALALFVEYAGAAALPPAYAAVAGGSVLLMAGYVLLAERAGSLWVFQVIVGASAALFAAAWLVGGEGWHGVLFGGRELAFTLVLMHFGTFLQDYFTRGELLRVLPVVYAGGRLGGIAGGWLLERLGGPEVRTGLPIVAGLCAVSMLAMLAIAAAQRPAPGQEEPPDPAARAPHEEDATQSLAGFLRFVWESPLLYWLSVSSVLFLAARWVMNYRYAGYFADHFETPGDMAAFLGRYTQVALAGSLLLQLFVVNRLTGWLGAAGAHLLFAAIVAGAGLLGAGEMTMASAITLRLVETELRLGLRNPLTQQLTALFSRPVRLRVRAWTMGLLTPLGTALAAVVLLVAPAAWAVGVAGVAFLLSAVGVWWAAGHPPREADSEEASGAA